MKIHQTTLLPSGLHKKKQGTPKINRPPITPQIPKYQRLMLLEESFLLPELEEQNRSALDLINSINQQILDESPDESENNLQN